MHSENDVKHLEKEIKQLEEMLQDEIRRSHRTLRLSAAVAITLGVTILLFVTVNFLKIKSEWTEENFSASLQKEMRELSPTAMREFNIMGKDLAPVYVAEAKAQLTNMGPEISKRLEAELEQLSSEVLNGVNTRLLESQERVIERCERVLFENYPDLQDPVEREALSKRFHARTEDAVVKVVGDFHGRFGHEVERVQELLLKFDISDSDETMLDLQKEFIHLWLQLLDQEIMEL